MKKRVGKHKSHPVHHRERPVRWLPVDSRFITPIFKFGSVDGVERIFLEIEITLTIFVVLGTLGWAGLRIVQLLTR